MKEDGTLFDKKDFAAYVKGIRPLASLIANETDLSKYHPADDKPDGKSDGKPADSHNPADRVACS